MERAVRTRAPKGDLDCRLARSVLSERVDRDLPPQVLGAVTAYVASCPGCATLARRAEDHV